MYAEKIYQLALTQVPQIGPVLAKALLEHFNNASQIFAANKKALTEVDGISFVKADAIKNFSQFDECAKELNFVDQHNIQLLAFNDTAYPKRLRNCYDPPTLLFCKGTADLQHPRTVGIIGTRSLTDYGRQLTEKLVEDLAAHQVMVISGMAYGIDAAAHKACVKNNVPTVGVLAHGLQTLYPADNAKIASQMIVGGGGLISEFWSGTQPDKHNFPIRNRVVAGLCDAIVIVETDVKGGSMITAELAIGYNKDVFAFPGKVTETKSKGCHQLIRQNKAALITGAQDLLEAMNWLPAPEKKLKIQRSLFIQFTANEQLLVDMLQLQDSLAIDELLLGCGLSNSAASAALLNLELQGVVGSLPGKRYKLI